MNSQRNQVNIKQKGKERRKQKQKQKLIGECPFKPNFSHQINLEFCLPRIAELRKQEFSITKRTKRSALNNVFWKRFCYSWPDSDQKTAQLNSKGVFRMKKNHGLLI